eukprot:2203357-Amphidinium_carterae.1
MKFYCSAGATTTTTTTPPPQDTFYSRAHLVSNQTGQRRKYYVPIPFRTQQKFWNKQKQKTIGRHRFVPLPSLGMFRVRFFTTVFADPTSPDDPNPGLKVIRIGQ